jgi:hypothetical protein
MSNQPVINVGDWIDVEGVPCVVANTRDEGHFFGYCEVVCNPKKPSNRDVKWSNEKWVFDNPNDFGGYADKYQRLNNVVSILKRGKRNQL